MSFETYLHTPYFLVTVKDMLQSKNGFFRKCTALAMEKVLVFPAFGLFSSWRY